MGGTAASKTGDSGLLQDDGRVAQNIDWKFKAKLMGCTQIEDEIRLGRELEGDGEGLCFVQQDLLRNRRGIAAQFVSISEQGGQGTVFDPLLIHRHNGYLLGRGDVQNVGEVAIDEMIGGNDNEVNVLR